MAERLLTTAEAAEVLACSPKTVRQVAAAGALWATALYSGLRRGELTALTWEHVDLAEGVIRVERSYDPKAGQYVTPKSRAGTRTVPIASALREYLIAHKLRAGRSDGLVFATRKRDTVRLLGAKGASRQGVEGSRANALSAFTRVATLSRA